MKLLIIALVFAGLAGCSTVKKVSEFVQDNQILTNVAMQQAVMRHIERKGEENEQSRALRVLNAVNNLESYLDSEPTVTLTALLDKIDVANLNQSDQVLVYEIIDIFMGNLIERTTDEIDLSDESIETIRTLFSVMRRSAEIYLVE